MKKDILVLKDENCIYLEECSSLTSNFRESFIYGRSLGEDE